MLLPLPRMVKKTEKLQRSEMIKLFGGTYHLSVWLMTLEKKCVEGFPLLRRNSVLFCCQRGTNETSFEASSALVLLSVDIWFLPNQQLVHTFLPVVSYYGAAGLLRELFSVPALTVVPLA